jgi:hypothetical protein
MLDYVGLSWTISGLGQQFVRGGVLVEVLPLRPDYRVISVFNTCPRRDLRAVKGGDDMT